MKSNIVIESHILKCSKLKSKIIERLSVLLVKVVTRFVKEQKKCNYN